MQNGTISTAASSAVVAVAGVFAGAANADTIRFDEYHEPGSNIGHLGSTIQATSDDGVSYTLVGQATNPANTTAEFITLGDGLATWPGEVVIGFDAGFDDALITLFRTDGLPFDLNGFSGFTFDNTTPTISFDGIDQFGGTQSVSATFNGQQVLAHYNTQLDQVVAVSFVQGFSSNAPIIGDIYVNEPQTPESGSLALLGLGAATLLSRRRRDAVAPQEFAPAGPQ